jgi:hypothetical protein
MHLDRLAALAPFVIDRLPENWTPVPARGRVKRQQISGWLKGDNEGGFLPSAMRRFTPGSTKLWKLLPRRKEQPDLRLARKP